MSNLSIGNVVDISVSQSGKGLGKYNTSNLALFTRDPYDAVIFGTDPYALYLEPIDVGKAFGTESQTFKMALNVFSQNPNIRTSGGYLAVIPLIDAVRVLNFPSIPDEGSFKIEYEGEETAAISFDADATEVERLLREIVGLDSVVVTGTVGVSFAISLIGVADTAPFSVIDNSLEDDGATVTPTFAADEEETINQAIVRSKDLIQYFGIMSALIENEVDMLAAAATTQALNKISFVVSNDVIDISAGGKLDLLRTGSFTKTRGLYHAGTVSIALDFLAAYAGRALSTNFSGASTTQTMHLKDLAGVQPDLSITQTILNKLELAGVDAYVSIEGVPKTFTSGANEFFDDVYNLGWIVGALQVAGFNLLASVSTKIPQTEAGLSQLKGAYRKVCEQGVVNNYLSAGAWTSATTFGNLADLHENIEQRGYYIYSQPVAKQSPTDREARLAPLIQIGLKASGANHKTSVIVNINK